MELLVELDAAGDIAPDQLQLPDDVGEAAQPLGDGLWGLVQRERLERGEDGAEVAQLRSVEGGEAKSSARLRGEQPFAGESEQGLADRGSADPQFGGNGGIANPGADGEVALLDALQDLEIDLL